MTYLLIWNKFERKELIIKVLYQYYNNIYYLDEIHYLLDLIIHDILRLEDNLFENNFYKLCENFKNEFIDYYNDSPENEIDVDPSNYILKDEFEKWIKIFYIKIKSLN